MGADRLNHVTSRTLKLPTWLGKIGRIDGDDRRFVIFTSIAAYLGISVTYNIAQYQSLGAARVTVAALLFVALFLCFFALSHRGESWRFPRPQNFWVGLWIPLVTLFAWMSSFPSGERFQEYYPAFPLNSIDSGGPIGRDTLFHETLIQSIMSFGYPSTGLNDVPLLVYHTLSHYTESAILLISGLEPLDSAGLFFDLKVVLIVASIVLLLSAATKNRSFTTFVVAVIVAVPALTSRWLITWSLALWLTTFILIATARFSHRAITSAARPTGATLVGLGVIGVALCLGKISSGMIYILVVGIHLLISHARDRRIYLLGTSWLVFLVVYGWQFARDRTIVPAEDGFSVWNGIKSVAKMMLLNGKFPQYTQDLYVLGGVIIITWVLYRRRSTVALALSLATGFAGICVLQFLGTNPHDVRYFAQALFFVVLLFTVLEILSIPPTASLAKPITSAGFRRWSYVAFVGVLAIAVTGTGRAPLDVLAESPTSIIKPFSEVRPTNDATSPRIEEFRHDLKSFMASEGLNKRNSLLFIPSEVWPDLSARLAESDSLKAGKSWSHPFVVYAATGVPLLNGIVAWEDYYGFSAYSERNVVIPAAQLPNSDPCRFGKTIITVAKWHPAAFSTQCGASGE